MTQLRETRCLTTGQIETIIKNWCTVLNVSKCTVIDNKKPNFSHENIEKYNLPHLTKFASNYTLYGFERKNLPTIYAIVIETDKFDKINIQACIWYYHFFQDNIYQTQQTRPEVFICPAFVITDAMYLHVPINILPCMYRFVPLPDLYPLIGSRNVLYSMTYDYKILDKSELGGTRKYSIVLDSDPIIKVLNAIVGDTIQYKRVLCEGSPYGEYYRRTVESTVTDVNVISPSGICYGKTLVE